MCKDKYQNILHLREITPPEIKIRQTNSKIRRLEVLPSVKSTDSLTFSIYYFLFEMMKDEIQKSFGLCCLYIEPNSLYYTDRKETFLSHFSFRSV